MSSRLFIRPLRSAALLAACVVAFAGCSSTPAASPADVSPGPSTATPGPFPVTVENALGDALVPARPVRVVAVGMSELDTVLALGTVPVAFGAFGESALYSYQAAALDGASPPAQFDLTDGVPIEKIAAYRPDLIVNMSWGTPADYEKLSKIAPVVSWLQGPFADGWEAQVAHVAPALGVAERGDAATDEALVSLHQAKAANPDLTGTSVTYATTGAAGGLCVVDLPTAPALLLLEELGLVPDPDFLDPASLYCAEVSPEEFATVDAELLVMVAGPQEQQALEASRPFGRIPAVAGGHVVWLDSAGELANALNSPTLLSVPLVMSDVVPLLAAAAR